MSVGTENKLDFNDTEPPRPQWDVEQLSARLADCAADWVPLLFPRGRITDDKNELRLANIGGDGPKKQGSCVINLKGDHAGCFNDFDTGEGGGPLATLKEATGLSGAGLFQKAADLIGLSGPPKTNGHTGNGLTHHPATNGHTAPETPKNHAQEIAHILAHAVTAANTPVEAYLKSRKLILPYTSDILFNENLTDWKSKTGYAGMIAVVRGRDGEPTGGIHRTYLQENGAGKADIQKAKMMLGPCEGGAVRLAELDGSGRLGVAEGIESAIAAMMIHNVPVWAALSTSGIRNFEIPDNVKELIIFADAGKAGVSAANVLIGKATLRNIPAYALLPKSGDDFNADLFLPPEPELPPQEVLQPLKKPSIGEIEAAIAALTTGSDTALVAGVLHQIVVAEPDRLLERQWLNAIKRQTNLPIAALSGVATTIRQELGYGAKKVVGSPSAPKDSTPAPAWFGQMIFSDRGEPRPLIANAITALRYDLAWKDALSFNEFTLDICIRTQAPWDDAPTGPRAWTDIDTHKAAEWLQRNEICVSSEVAGQAVEVVARDKAFHPVREFLDGVVWDGKARLDKWLTYYLGVDPTSYAEAVGARWMISAVARIYDPGVKADCCLILRGEQGIKKSTALGVLGDPWFTDELADLGSKDASMQTGGVWIIEIAELDSMTRAEVNKIKAFMSRRVDRFRPPYGRRVLEAPRQSVFAGSVNESTFLKDATGARRFWPVLCRSIDIDSLSRDRNQLWAEAVARYKKGEIFWLEEDHLIIEAGHHQTAHYQRDSWEEIVLPWVARQIVVELKISEIMAGALQMKPNQWGRLEQKRIEDILKIAGYERLDSGGWRRINN